MSKKAVYKTYHEEDNKVQIDLTIKQDESVFEIIEKVHNVHIIDLTTDELNLVLSELEVPENIKLEIKKGILSKQVGFLEDTKHRFDEIMPRIKDDVNYIGDNIEIEYNQLEARIKKEIKEFEEKWNKLKDKF